MRFFLAFIMTLAVCTVTASAASIEGNWQGNGTVRLSGGQLEKVRCRVRYEAGTGRTFVMFATCAHSNGIFKQTGRVVKLSESSYTGRLYSDQYGVAGEVSVRLNGNRQTVTATSAQGTATFNLSRQ